MLPLYKSPKHIFNYDEIPPGYYYQVMQTGKASQRFWHRHKFLAVVRKIPDRGRILDLGCGPGSFLSILGRERPEVQAIGVDIASPQIEFASREIASQFSDGRIQFQKIDSDTFRLPFDAASFDVVTNIEVIEHIHPHLAYRILEDVQRVLKPAGRLILTTPNYRSAWPFIELLLERLSPVKYHAQHINKFTPNSLVKFLETVGFEVLNAETIFTIAPFLAGLSESLARSVLTWERLSKFRIGSLLVVEARPDLSVRGPVA